MSIQLTSLFIRLQGEPRIELNRTRVIELEGEDPIEIVQPFERFDPVNLSTEERAAIKKALGSALTAMTTQNEALKVQLATSQQQAEQLQTLLGDTQSALAHMQEQLTTSETGLRAAQQQHQELSTFVAAHGLELPSPVAMEGGKSEAAG